MTMTPLRRVLIGRAVHDPAAVSCELAAHMMSAACCSRGTAAAISAALTALRIHDSGPITCPTLIVGGGRDQLVSEGSLRLSAAAIRGARLEILADVGHNPMFERPMAFNALLRLFFDEVAAA
jgi:pimeloyl-ACP methyl ester carboxylesterase